MVLHLGSILAHKLQQIHHSMILHNMLELVVILLKGRLKAKKSKWRMFIKMTIWQMF